MERNKGKRPEALDGPPCPPPLRYLWDWFCEIHVGRSPAFGTSRASHVDIMAWQFNTGIRLEPWEARAISALGNKFLEVMTDPPPPSK